MIKEKQEQSERGNPFENKFVQQSWRFIGLFVMVLVLTLPFYSANAMAASVTITSNSGEEGIEGYLDAENDIWSLEVEISSDEELDISPEQVILDVSGSQIEFDSCSSSSLTSTCEFQSVLSNGITEGSYSFEVILYDLEEDPDDENSTELGSELASDTDSVIADGSEPSISFSSSYQEDGMLYLDFSVEDQPNACVGLDYVEVIDAESGEVFETFELADSETCDFDYIDDGENGGILSAELDGEGTRYFKIKAVDLLGHDETTAPKSVDTDFIAPVVDTNTLLLSDFGDYIGDYSQSSDVLINITECGDLESVTATSDYIEFLSQEAVCSYEDSESCTWECEWYDITINPEGDSVSASITSIDEAGNEEIASVSSSFETDSNGPEIVYFGTGAVFDDISYVGSGQQNAIVYLYVTETGSGIDEETVVANLAGIGGSSEDTPTKCAEDDSGIADYYCYWEVDVKETSGTTTSEINIHYLEDKVGNSGDSETIPIVIDGVAPIITGVEFYGFSAVGEKDYFQSNDDLFIDIVIQESSGLVVYVDANDIVMDAENYYQYGTYDDDGDYVESDMDGWIPFDESSCTRDEETSYWDCEFQVDSIKSGPDSSAEFQLIVMDTGNNDADWTLDNLSVPENVEVRDLYDGEFSLNIFGLDEETQPDFWEQDGDATSQQEYIDLDTVELTYTSMFFNVELENDIGALAAHIELDDCAASEENSDAPTLSRSLMYGGVFLEEYEDPLLNIVLEFEPFDPTEVIDLTEFEEETFETIEYEYVCELHVYSVVDDTAMNYAESQTVTMTVPFGYSQNGALDANVDAMLYDAVDNVGFKILKVANTINKVTKWLGYAQKIYSGLMSLITLIRGIGIALDSNRAYPPGQGYATAFCAGETGAEAGSSKILDSLGKALEVLTCNPEPITTNQIGAVAAYGKWQQTVLDWWQTLKGNSIQFLPEEVSIINKDTANLYDNIIVSTVGICIPGIAYNLDKYAQIECTYIKCLNEGVKEGITTIDVCQKTKTYQYCKNIVGEVMTFIPFDDLQFLMDFFKNLILDPIGTAFAIIEVACGGSFCAGSSAGKVGCSIAGWFYKMVEVVNNVYGIVIQYPAVKYDVCSEPGVKEVIDSYKAEKKAEKESGEEESESVTTEDLAGDESSDEE